MGSIRSRCRVFPRPFFSASHAAGSAVRRSSFVRSSFRSFFFPSSGFFSPDGFSFFVFSFSGLSGLGSSCTRTGPAMAVTRSSSPNAMCTPTRSRDSRNSAAAMPSMI